MPPGSVTIRKGKILIRLPAEKTKNFIGLSSFQMLAMFHFLSQLGAGGHIHSRTRH